MKTEVEIIREFVLLTGACEQTARVFLTSCHWDVKQATIQFNKQSSKQGEEARSDAQETGRSERNTVQSNQSEMFSHSQQHETEIKTVGKHAGAKSKISRGFSVVDPDMVSKLHNDIKTKGDSDTDENYGYFQDVTHYNFTLPNFSLYDAEFVEFLMRDLIESSTLKALEDSGHLNWWTKRSNFQRLLPWGTSGDGNCLLHAASLGIWGVHDRQLNLRQAVHRTLSSNLAERTIKQRWRWHEWVKNMGGGEMVWEPTEEEWEAEWRSVLSLALARPRIEAKQSSALERPQNEETKQSLSTVHEVNNVSDVKNTNEAATTVDPSCQTRPRRFSAPPEPRYESLEEIHIFSLAHVLCRPIVVVADTMLYDFEGNALCPIPFAGVYLPVECIPAECCRIPLVLAYSSGHFSPLVAMETTQLTNTGASSQDDKAKVVVPLVDKQFETLPLPFALYPGSDWTQQSNMADVIKQRSLTSDERMKLLQKYLDVVHVNVKVPSIKQSKPVGQSALVPAAFGKDGDAMVEHSVPVVMLPCDNQPSYYSEFAARYISRAKERFQFEQETNKVQPPSSNAGTIQCANDGCDLFGTVAYNYLCSKCFQLQTKSIKEFEGTTAVPSNQPPPSYAEATGNQDVFYPPTRQGPSTLPQCHTTGCTFYGTANKNGFCSKCYNDNNKS